MTEIQIEFDVSAEMRDGTVLRADVYRPGGSGPWPVLLSRLPYGKQMPLAVAILDPLAAARRGFMVVLQDTRGRSPPRVSGSHGRTRSKTGTTPYGGLPPFPVRTAPSA